jgi:hypothetical protein
MKCTDYVFPTSRAVTLSHPEAEANGLIAVVRPTSTPGISHCGVLDTRGPAWRFVSGPFIRRTDRVIKSLRKVDWQWDGAVPVAMDAKHAWSDPSTTLDGMIELIVGEVAP